jgi:capsular polysaccharide export protein
MITIKSNELKQFDNLKELLEENISDITTEETTCYALWGNNSLETKPPVTPNSKKTKKKFKKEKVKQEPSLNTSSSENSNESTVNNEAGINPENSSIDNQPVEAIKSYPILRLKDGIFAGYSNKKSSYSLYYAFESDVYYNLKKESNIESLLRSYWVPSEEEWQTAHLAIEMINKYGITKYSEYPHISESAMRGVGYENILLVDQPIDDESVLLGNADEQTFNDMLLYAFDNYQYANIYVKLHPDTIDGKKEGYLQKLLVKHGLNDHPSIKLIDTHCNITSLFHFINDIFVVTSQVGFEALLRNKNVRCFGTPFYSGWGLTTDMQTLSESKPQRSLMDLFIALVLQHTLYLNPFTGKKGTILDLLEYVALQQRHNNKKNVAFYNTDFIEHRNVDVLLNADKKNFSAITKAKQIPKHIDDFILTDKKSTFQEVEPLKYRAFLSKSFLFSDSVSNEDVLSLIVDHNGPFYDPKAQSDLDYMLNHETYTNYEKNCAEQFLIDLRGKFLMDMRNEDSGNVLSEKQNSNKKLIFIPGQLEEDDMTLVGGDITIPSDYELLVAILQKVENSLIIYKPALGSKFKKLNDIGKGGLVNLSSLVKERNNRFVFEFDASISHCIEAADEVHLLNHTCGLEAIVKGKKVVTYGLPFYGGLGLTEDKQKFPREKREISLEEFALAVYMLYPRYKLPNEEYFTSASNALKYDKEKHTLVVKPKGFFSKLKAMF